VVNVKLTDVGWFEVAVLTVIFLVYSVRVSALNNVSAVDGIASEPAGDVRHFAISCFDFGRATD
jgi:hypothetical protein